MVLLSLLFERPMHPYRMQQLIKSRRKDSVVNVARSNSIYQVIDKLLRDNLIRVNETQAAGTGPSRTLYELTNEGRAALDRWLGSMLSESAREFPEFRAALAVTAIITPATLRAHLSNRVTALERDVAEITATIGQAEQFGLPPVLLLEDSHRLVLTRAELEWVRGVVAELDSGKLTWSFEELIAMSDRLEPEA